MVPQWDTTTRKKIGLVIIRVMSRTSVRDFMSRNQGIYVYMPKLDPKIPQNGQQRTVALF